MKRRHVAVHITGKSASGTSRDGRTSRMKIEEGERSEHKNREKRFEAGETVKMMEM